MFIDDAENKAEFYNKLVILLIQLRQLEQLTMIFINQKKKLQNLLIHLITLETIV